MLKRPIGAELRRYRLERAMALLKDTKDGVAATAGTCGYTDDKHLRNSLHRATGQAPGAWRGNHSMDHGNA